MSLPQFYSWGDLSLDGVRGGLPNFLGVKLRSWRWSPGRLVWEHTFLLTAEIDHLNLLFPKSLLGKCPFKKSHKCKQVKQTRPGFFIRRFLNVTVTDDKNNLWDLHYWPCLKYSFSKSQIRLASSHSSCAHYLLSVALGALQISHLPHRKSLWGKWDLISLLKKLRPNRWYNLPKDTWLMCSLLRIWTWSF